MAFGLAISLISAAALAYEILLVRLLSIIQWYHFAYMIISLALLGIGASGTFLTLARGWVIPRFHAAFAAGACLFGATVCGVFALAQHLPLNLLEILWNPGQLLPLAVVYLLLSIPFFCSGGCIGLALSRFRDRIHHVYRYDLIGAGAGALGIIGMTFVLSPPVCLRILGAAGFLSGGLMLLTRRGAGARGAAAAVILGGMGLSALWPGAWLQPVVSEYKGLCQVLRLPDARIIGEDFSPLGWVAVVKSPTVPLRHAPGLSLRCDREPPEQLGVFIDGEGLTPITHYDGKRESIAYLDCQSSALPYHLLDRPRVLVLGAGGGADVLLAVYHRAKAVDAVELNPQVIRLVKETHAGFAGHLYQMPGVRIHRSEARGFVAASREHYDLIQISLLDSFGVSAAGGHALSETYLYTREALEAYLEHLRPGGLLSITRWLKMPPRDGLKLFATAAEAARSSWGPGPTHRLMLIRSWKTTTLLVKNGAFSDEEILRARRFCEERSFDLAYYPGMGPKEANRFNLLERPYLYEGAVALLGEKRGEFIRRYKFRISPATDDRPYFFHFAKWRTLPEIFRLRGSGGMHLLEWTFPTILLTLLQAGLIGFLLVLSPLLIKRRNVSDRVGRGRFLSYFLAIGLGFLFIEVSAIQRFVLFLGDPLYAVSVVLCAFLVFAGIGSGCSRRLSTQMETKGRAFVPGIILAGILFLSSLYLGLLPAAFHRWIGLPPGVKIPLSIALIAPLAFFMGMPFPVGLSRAAGAAPGLIPWCWAVNGCASVISPILATIIAIHLGFTGVMIAAMGLYTLAALALIPLRDKAP